ncbi:uncharacterized protein ISCGN_032404 [Ixodes scapularis]
MPFSPDTGKPRTARRGRANPHGSGSVETPLSKHLLSQVPPAGPMEGASMVTCQSQHDHGWIPAYNPFKSITGNKLLLKDLAQMSPHGQPYALEAFHSVLIDFAPKSQAFSPEGMLAKTRLAILHFNENSNRCQAVTREGKPRWSVVTSKARKGHHTARPEITDPTYKYVGKLIKEAMESSKQWRSLAAASKANTVVFPAPMTAAYTRPPKEELVAARMSRFGQSPQ